MRRESEFRPHTPALDVVVRLQENLAQPRLAQWVVLEVEAVKPLEGLAVSVHVQGVHAQVVRSQVQRLEHLRISGIKHISVEWRAFAQLSVKCSKKAFEPFSTQAH